MLDARGLLCPMPVIQVQKAVRAGNPDTLEILVDDRCAVENISRFAGHAGYQVETQAQGPDFLIKLSK